MGGKVSDGLGGLHQNIDISGWPASLFSWVYLKTFGVTLVSGTEINERNTVFVSRPVSTRSASLS